MMHSQLDFDAPALVQEAMKLRCASRGYSYLPPFGGAFGSGLTFTLGVGALALCEPAWVAGLGGGGFCACVLVCACVELVLVVVCVPGAVVPAGVVPAVAPVLAVVDVLDFLAEPQPLARTASAISPQTAKGTGLSIVEA